MWGHHKKRGLRSWVILLVGRGPKTGAEIIDEMESMTHGWWRPSPGSVYPLLEEMVGEKALHRRDDGRYELTAGVRADPIWSWVPSPRTPPDVVRELSSLVSYLEDVALRDAASTVALGEELRAVAHRIEKLSGQAT
jgi:PadR family transcriptional regulator